MTQRCHRDASPLHSKGGEFKRSIRSRQESGEGKDPSQGKGGSAVFEMESAAKEKTNVFVTQGKGATRARLSCRGKRAKENGEVEKEENVSAELVKKKGAHVIAASSGKKGIQHP